MTKAIESIQKIIKVGDSLAVTIPAKDARALGYSSGDLVQSRIEHLDPKPQEAVSSEYEKFSKQYKTALKNLSDR